MCPIWPYHYVIMYLLVLVPLLLIVTGSSGKFWNVNFGRTESVKLRMYEVTTVQFQTNDLSEGYYENTIIRVEPSDPDIILCTPDLFDFTPGNETFVASFNVTGKFVGMSNVKLKLMKAGYEDMNDENVIKESSPLKIVVVRRERIIDKMFTICVIVLVSIIFINFGCALDWEALKESMRKPVTPVIGCVVQIIFMPLIGFILGALIFPDSVVMRLGLFFTGISPSGGASNIWIYMLGGNMNLSITITTLCNMLHFITMPLWTFTLGTLIFSSGYMTVPYTRIASYTFTLIVPLLIGFLLQQKCPKISKLMVRILKPFSGCLIVFIIVFATLTNLYLFKLFTGRIMLAGFSLPLLGYISSWLVARSLKRKPDECLAISVETGVLNTGIAIFMLRLSLSQPEADLTTVVPVAVALFTPVPLLVLLLWKKLYAKSTTEKSVVSYPVDDKISATTLIDESPKFVS